MKQPLINDVPYLWAPDGSLRDVYIYHTQIEDWDRFGILCRSYRCNYRYDGENASLPSMSGIFANRDGSHLLSIFLGAVCVNCHFFIEQEIELDIDPREIFGEAEHDAVLTFVSRLSLALKKPAHITPENSEEVPILTYDPVEASWLIHR